MPALLEGRHLTIRRGAMMRGVGITLMLCGLAVSARAAEPQPLPAEVVQAWEKAGARAGWMGSRRVGGYLLFSDQLKELESDRTVPAFRFPAWESGRIGKLPVPERGFGLSFRNTLLTDAGVKELAGLKNLASLSLSVTKVTDAGVKELQKALPKCSITR
jgi:hypothetical protein